MNPISGKRVSLFRKALLTQWFAKEGYPVFTTRGKDHAREIANRSLQEGAEALVVIGGDGTLNEAIQDLPPYFPVAYYPCGTINLLGMTLKIPRGPRKWWRMWEKGDFQPVYPVRGNERRFLSVASVGLDAEVVRKTSSLLKQNATVFAYFLQSWKTFFQYTPPEMVLSTHWGETKSSFSLSPLEDGKNRSPKEKIVGVLLGKIPYFAGSFTVFPESMPEKREFTVVVLQGTKMDLLRYAFGLFTNRLPKMKGVEIFPASSLVIKTDPPLSIEMDGEWAGETPVHFQSEKEPLWILSPKKKEPPP